MDGSGHKKKGPKDGEITNTGEGEKGCDNDSAPTNGKGKKMIRGPMTCKKCGQKGHRQASAKCPLNGTKKRGSVGNLRRMLQKLCLQNLTRHKGLLEKKSYMIVQEGSLEASLRCYLERTHLHKLTTIVP